MNRFLDSNVTTSQKDFDQLDDAKRIIRASGMKRYRITTKFATIETTNPERWRGYYKGEKLKIEEL